MPQGSTSSPVLQQAGAFPLGRHHQHILGSASRPAAPPAEWDLPQRSWVRHDQLTNASLVTSFAARRYTEQKKAPAFLTGCVETRGSGDPGPFFWDSGETGPKTRGANQIDCSQDVVGEYAERNPYYSS